jgi:hypothetical protein
MLIPVFRVITTQFPIASTTTIEPGMVVTLNSTTGYAEKCDLADVPVGIAADRNRASESYEWVNRVSDSGNDTAASGMLSVYSSGEFYVDVNDGAITTPNGTAITGVVVDGATTTPGSYLYTAASGQMDDTTTNATAVAICLEDAGSEETGIPGEYEPGSSVAYADDATPRTWVKIRLLV